MGVMVMLKNLFNYQIYVKLYITYRRELLIAKLWITMNFFTSY